MDGQYGPNETLLQIAALSRSGRANAPQCIPCLRSTTPGPCQPRVPRGQGIVLLRHGDHSATTFAAESRPRHSDLCYNSRYSECLRDHVGTSNATYEPHCWSPSFNQGMWLECPKHRHRSRLLLVKCWYGASELPALQLASRLGPRSMGY